MPIGVLDELSARSLAPASSSARWKAPAPGAGGLVASLLDVPTLLLLNFRFMAQIAHTLRLRDEHQPEQAFVLNVLGVAAATSGLRGAFAANLNRLAAELARQGVGQADRSPRVPRAAA